MIATTSVEPLPYTRIGTGPALLMIHGAMVDSSYWQLQQERLATQFTLIMVDLPGHGKAPALSGSTSLAEFARAVLATLDTLDLPDVLCLGHSLGGMVAQELSLLAPERVRALILADTWCHSRGFIGETLPFQTVYLHWMLRVIPTFYLVELMAFGLAMRNSAIGPYVRQVMARHTRESENFLAIWDAATDFSSRDQLFQISCPTLVLVSDEYAFTQRQAIELARRIPAAELTVIPQSGHWLNWDNPAEFEAAVLGFLGRVA